MDGWQEKWLQPRVRHPGCGRPLLSRFSPLQEAFTSLLQLPGTLITGALCTLWRVKAPRTMCQHPLSLHAGSKSAQVTDQINEALTPPYTTCSLLPGRPPPSKDPGKEGCCPCTPHAGPFLFFLLFSPHTGAHRLTRPSTGILPPWNMQLTHRSFSAQHRAASCSLRPRTKVSSTFPCFL